MNEILALSWKLILSILQMSVSFYTIEHSVAAA
jgi:hypothetical protein